MATTNTKRPSYKKVSAEGIAVWPRLNEPDFKFKKEAGEFQCRLRVAREDVAELLEELEADAKKAYDEAMAALKEELAGAKTGQKKAQLKERIGKFELASLPFKDDVDDEGEPNGFVILNFKMPFKVSWTDKAGKKVERELRPDIFDASGKQLKNPPAIWGGSQLAVSGEVRPFAAPLMAGVSLRLAAVQIIELQSGSGEASASSYGFGKREGGYEAGDEETSAPQKKTTSADEGEDAPADDEDF